MLEMSFISLSIIQQKTDFSGNTTDMPTNKSTAEFCKEEECI